MFDVLITGGTVVNGTGTPGVAADVGITDDKIAAIGELSDASAARTIHATGLTVAPGFIDTHAHSDGALLLDPQHANGLRQGITTEILGQDGLSYAPLSHEDYLMYRQYLSGIYGLPPEDIAWLAADPSRRARWEELMVHTVLPPLRELVPVVHTKVRIDCVPRLLHAPSCGRAC